MAMEARLSLRQSQRVVMTPLLQQAIQLLQLSTLELQEVVQKELLENPLLEEVTPDTPETTDAPVTPDSPPAPTVEQVTEAPGTWAELGVTVCGMGILAVESAGTGWLRMRAPRGDRAGRNGCGALREVRDGSCTEVALTR